MFYCFINVLLYHSYLSSPSEQLLKPTLPRHGHAMSSTRGKQCPSEKGCRASVKFPSFCINYLFFIFFINKIFLNLLLLLITALQCMTYVYQICT